MDLKTNGQVAAANDTAAAILAGAALGTPKLIAEHGLTLVVVPPGHNVKEINTEKFLDRPTRKRGTTTLHDAASFILAVKYEKTPNTAIYATQDPPTFTAVFNGNQQADDSQATAAIPVLAGWGDHKARYDCPLSDEWKTWTGANNGKHMNQVDFARFIEDNLPDIVEPAGADMLEVSRTLEAKKAVNFASATRLSDGAQQFTYEETIEGTAAKGRLQVPERFKIGIPIFQGSTELWPVTARLRYRIDGGRLSLWYDLEREHKVLEQAVNEMRATIEKETGLKTLMGTPAW